MPRAKKDISKDLMFQKIMPSADIPGKRDDGEAEAPPITEGGAIAENTSQADNLFDKPSSVTPDNITPPTAKQNVIPEPLYTDRTPPNQTAQQSQPPTKAQQMVARTLSFSSDADNEGYLINTMEKLVFDNLDAILSRFKCCKCDRCQKDMLALALNSLTPKYIVATKDKPPPHCHDPQVITEVTTALVRAVVQVKKEPRH